MADTRQYKVRSDLKSDGKDPFRVYINYSALADHGLKPGTPCLLTLEDGRSFMGTAWNPEKQLDTSVVQVSQVFREMHDLKLSDRVTIEKFEGSIPAAESITVYESSGSSSDPDQDLLLKCSKEEQTSFLDLARSQRFRKLQDIAIGMPFEVKQDAIKRTFKISNVRPVLPYRSIYKITANTVITLAPEGSAKAEHPLYLLSIPSNHIGGLPSQLQRLQRRVEAYSDNSRWIERENPLIALQGGVLLYGRSGTGKSLLLEQVAAAGWQRAFWVEQSDVSGRGNGLQSIIDLALQLEPSVIILDWLEGLVGSKEERSGAVGNIMTAFKRTNGSRVLLVAATAKIRDIPEQLRQQSSFKHQISIPVPDSKARAEILKILLNKAKDQKDDLLDDVASRTHGYVGGDLNSLLLEAQDYEYDQILRETPKEDIQDFHELISTTGSVPKDRKVYLRPAQQAWDAAIAEIKPSAMNDVFIETPKVRWTDIGGYHSIKKQLKFAFDLQIKYAEQWAAFHVEPMRGILLYGPPGCSKTLIAKAVATEMGLNFLAVKGAEILDKYVGESERKLREIFDTARAASPSVIFFDEIDALGASRDGNVPGGLHLLTTMLNELDGIEARKNVFVLAATNRPDVLDAALMRPGRLDRHIFVGPPDELARREILEGKLTRPGVPFPFDAVALLPWLVDSTEGFSGAEVVDVVNGAFYSLMEERAEGNDTSVLDRRCFERSLARITPQITNETVGMYRAWGNGAAKGKPPAVGAVSANGAAA